MKKKKRPNPVTERSCSREHRQVNANCPPSWGERMESKLHLCAQDTRKPESARCTLRVLWHAAESWTGGPGRPTVGAKK